MNLLYMFDSFINSPNLENKTLHSNRKNSSRRGLFNFIAVFVFNLSFFCSSKSERLLNRLGASHGNLGREFPPMTEGSFVSFASARTSFICCSFCLLSGMTHICSFLNVVHTRTMGRDSATRSKLINQLATS